MPTTAPDLAALTSHEKYLPPAWAAILTAGLIDFGVSVGILFKTDLDADGNIIGKSTPFIDVVLTNVAPTGRKAIMEDGTERYDAWQGTMETTLVTTRGKDSEQTADILGIIRDLAERSLFDAEILPYHSVRLFRLAGGTPRIDQTQRLDL